MFYPSRVIDINDGKPKWAGLDNQSDLLDDEGNIIKKWEQHKEERKEEHGKESPTREEKGTEDDCRRQGRLPSTRTSKL